MLIEGVNRTYDQRNECWEYFDVYGEYHRDGDKPAIVCKDGSFAYYKHGKSHREGDKPSGKANMPDNMGFTFTYRKNGKLHREGDKPALIMPNGCRGYYLNGEQYKREGCGY